MTREQLRVFIAEHFCGCGSPDGAATALLRLLEIWSDPARKMYLELPNLVQDDGAMWLLLYLVDRHTGLIEHGGNVLASWLTEKGEHVLEALRRESADNFAAMFQPHCSHGFDLDGATHDCSAAEKSAQRGSA